MNTIETTSTAVSRLATFVAAAEVPPSAREIARDAVQDTIGVALAGAAEAASLIVQRLVGTDGGSGLCSVLGTSIKCGPSFAALANGTAAHALDFDDMCWISLAHPSAPLVSSTLALGEMADVSGRDFLDAYVVGFEIEAVLGRTMNPLHYTRGWHGTATIGTLGAAAAASRVLGLDTETTGRALAIASSEASGLKENFGTMVKPLQGGLAARNGVLAALLAREGFSASVHAIDGTQGLLIAMQSSGTDLKDGCEQLGKRWEIVEGGITMKLYPSCAATHPTIDTLIDLRREMNVAPSEIESVEISVDSVTPTVLIYSQPINGLEGKFSLHYCAAAALAFGHVGIDTFETAAMTSPEVQRILPLVKMRADNCLGVEAPPLTEARVTLRLSGERTVERFARGARGYPDRPASSKERDSKFMSCARRVVSPDVAAESLGFLRSLEKSDSVRGLSVRLIGSQLSQSA